MRIVAAAFLVFFSQLGAYERPVCCVFAHGIGANSTQAFDFSQTDDDNFQNWVLHEPFVTFDFPDALPEKDQFDRFKVTLGQGGDMAQLHATYTQACIDFPDHDFIFVGLSRGASTIINYIATYKPERVKALVLESPFDSVLSIIAHLLRRYKVGWLPLAQTLSLKFAKTYLPKMDPNGIFPRSSVKHIPHRIPVLLIHARTDQVVPIASSRLLYKSLLETGHKNVFLCELGVGDHGKLVIGKERELYTGVVHAFYRRCGLAHDPMLANQGAFMLPYCQPSIEKIERRLKKNR